MLPAVVMTSHSSSAFTSSCSTASTIGITMAVVEVLESHMESTVVQHIKQRSNLEHGETPGVRGGRKRRGEFVSFQTLKGKMGMKNAPNQGSFCPWMGRSEWFQAAALRVRLPQSQKSTHMPGLAPAIITMRRAIRLWRFHFSTEAATQITPMRSKVVFLKYSAATCIKGQGGSSQLKKQ